ncbi:MAG: hypothetical protein LIP01_02200 [Tannerellaceae bacterium]|nr:hypothetical protein [Tannerellaceae bacterium]
MSDAQYSSEIYHNLILLNVCGDQNAKNTCTPEFGVTHAMIAVYNMLNLDKKNIPTSAYDHPFWDAVTKSIPDIEAAAQY